MVIKNTKKNKEKTSLMNEQNNKKNNKNNSLVSKNEHKIKKKIGGNVFTAGIGLVVQSIELGGSMFKAAEGIMNMPGDLKRAVPPPEKKAPAQPAEAPPKKMPSTGNVPRAV